MAGETLAIEKLTKTVERGFAAIADDLNEIKSTMATKEELAAFRLETNENFRAIRTEIADIRRDLDDLRDKVENISGYRKEIDHALDRIAAIEHHLGIKNEKMAQSD
jgi:hypothetical protein